MSERIQVIQMQSMHTSTSLSFFLSLNVRSQTSSVSSRVVILCVRLSITIPSPRLVDRRETARLLCLQKHALCRLSSKTCNRAQERNEDAVSCKEGGER